MASFLFYSFIVCFIVSLSGLSFLCASSHLFPLYRSISPFSTGYFALPSLFFSHLSVSPISLFLHFSFSQFLRLYSIQCPTAAPLIFRCKHSLVDKKIATPLGLLPSLPHLYCICHVRITFERTHCRSGGWCVKSIYVQEIPFALKAHQSQTSGPRHPAPGRWCENFYPLLPW